MSSKVCALLLVDIQKGFGDSYWGKRNNPEFESNIVRLVAAARSSNTPLFHVQHLSIYEHSPLHSGKPGVDFMQVATPNPGEAIIQKRVHSAFIGTDLEVRLRDLGVNDLVIAGMTADHCVSTTARMASDLDFHVIVVSDATATFDRKDWTGNCLPANEIHRAALTSLHQEFGMVLNTEDSQKKLRPP